MARGYKVRLGDGSEIGPLDVSAVREWYQQGLITRKSAVLTPGSKRWTTLAEVAELKDLGAKSQSSAELRAAVEEATQSSSPTSSGPTSSRTRNRDAAWSGGSALSGLADHWRTLLAALLLFTSAVGVGLVAWKPQRVLPEFEGLPWTETALVRLVLRLCPVLGWRLGRRLARLPASPITARLFPP